MTLDSLRSLVDGAQLAEQSEQTPVLDFLVQLVVHDVTALERRLDLQEEARADHGHDLVDVARTLRYRQQVTTRIHEKITQHTKNGVELSIYYRTLIGGIQYDVLEVGRVIACHEVERLLQVVVLERSPIVARQS